MFVDGCCEWKVPTAPSKKDAASHFQSVVVRDGNVVQTSSRASASLRFRPEKLSAKMSMIPSATVVLPAEQWRGDERMAYDLQSPVGRQAQHSKIKI